MVLKIQSLVANVFGRYFQGQYVTEPFSMLSHVWLWLEPGATLMFGKHSCHSSLSACPLNLSKELGHEPGHWTGSQIAP